jgi:hypothetical protein
MTVPVIRSAPPWRVAWMAVLVMVPAIGAAQIRSILTGTVTAQDGSPFADAVVVVTSPSRSEDATGF